MDSYTIDPTNITRYDRDQAALETFWTFCVIVAGKNSDWAARKVGDLYTQARREECTPFDYLRLHRYALHNMLVANRVGQYGRIERALLASLDLDLRWASVDQLMAVPGVGPKTARFFILHTRPNAQLAVLDTHILRWLREEHGCKDAPKATPPAGQKYEFWEGMALEFFRDVYPGLTPAQADLMVWTVMSGRLADEGSPV